jgi:hypothetical protein
LLPSNGYWTGNGTCIFSCMGDYVLKNGKCILEGSNTNEEVIIEEIVVDNEVFNMQYAEREWDHS